TLHDSFRPSLDVRRNKFMWCATQAPFGSFTFIFEETPEGLFQAHVYPYDAGTWTFIVETSAETWRRAGLDRNVEATAAPGRRAGPTSSGSSGRRSRASSGSSEATATWHSRCGSSRSRC